MHLLLLLLVLAEKKKKSVLCCVVLLLYLNVRTPGAGNGGSRELLRVQSANCVPFRSRESGACSHGLQNRSRWVIVIACFPLLFSLVLILVLVAWK